LVPHNVCFRLKLTAAIETSPGLPAPHSLWTGLPGKLPSTRLEAQEAYHSRYHYIHHITPGTTRISIFKMLCVLHNSCHCATLVSSRPATTQLLLPNYPNPSPPAFSVHARSCLPLQLVGHSCNTGKQISTVSGLFGDVNFGLSACGGRVDSFGSVPWGWWAVTIPALPLLHHTSALQLMDHEGGTLLLMRKLIKHGV
jgi:hypothetical protein